MTTNIEACPVFTRWQVHCTKCGITFYVDSEPDAKEEDIMSLDELRCGEHPEEDHVLELV
jgi:hypothetical protein